MLVVVVGFFLFCFVFLFFCFFVFLFFCFCFCFVLFCFVRFFLFFFLRYFFFKKCFLGVSVNFPFVGIFFCCLLFVCICGYQIYNLAETKFDKILAKHICCLLFLNYNSV